MPDSPTLPAASQPPGMDFGRVASFYDVLAGLVFGGALRRAQRAALTAGLPPGPAPRLLVLGGGAGWVLTEIWRHRPQAHVLYVELSAQMLERTRARLRRLPPPPGASVELRQGTEAALQPGEQFDAIITFFVLDCFTEAALPMALFRLAAARQLGAPWLVADFLPARRGWRRWLLQVMYWFFGFTVGLRTRRLPPWPTELAKLGLYSTNKMYFFNKSIASLVWLDSHPTNSLTDKMSS